mgnify:CR=1 FL=1
MAYTSTFTVDASGSPESYTVKTTCRRITVYENAQAGTVDYDVYMPANSATPVRKPAGSKFTQESSGYFMPGDTPFALATALGSVTFAAEEE